MLEGIDMSVMQGAGIALAITMFGVIATSWGKIRHFISRLYSRLVVTATVNGYLSRAVLSHLNSKDFNKSRFGHKVYSALNVFVRPHKRRELVAFERSSKSPSVYRRGWRILWISTGSNKDGEQTNEINIKFFRGMFKADKFIQDAVDFWNELTRGKSGNRSGRYIVRRIFGKHGSHRDHGGIVEKGESSADDESSSTLFENRILNWNLDDLGPQINNKSPIDALSLHDDVLEAIEEAKRWRVSKNWFLDRGIPWRRGWLMCGKPGTGKTATARAVAEEFDLPVFVYDLASLNNGEFQSEWSKMLGHTPCMALIEDIDAVFNGRKNVAVGANETGLTFDTFLNCLDGVERADGLFLIITTNKVEVLDPALGIPNEIDGKSTRPGRVDRSIEMLPLNEAGRLKMAKRILEEWPETWDKIVSDNIDKTGAEFQEACCELAIKLFWGEKEKVNVGEVVEEEIKKHAEEIAMTMPVVSSEVMDYAAADIKPVTISDWHDVDNSDWQSDSSQGE